VGVLVQFIPLSLVAASAPPMKWIISCVYKPPCILYIQGRTMNLYLAI